MTFNSPVGIGAVVYDVHVNAFKVYYVQFYEKNIALKCRSLANGAGKTFLIGKRSIGRNVFIGPDAFEEALIASLKNNTTHQPDKFFENY